MTLLKYLSRSQLVRLLASGKIVDVGCGPREGAWFADNAINVDIIRYQENAPNLVLADAKMLPFRDYEFDTAVMSELLEHVDDPNPVLVEAQRVAKIIVLTVPNEYKWDKALNPFKNIGHKRFFTEDTLLKLVCDSGLQIVQFFRVDLGDWSHFLVLGISNGIVTRRSDDGSLVTLKNGKQRYEFEEAKG